MIASEQRPTRKRAPSPASEAAETALLEAFHRIANGTAKSGFEHLTKENVGLEAGYSRATAFRSQALSKAFNELWPKPQADAGRAHVNGALEQEAERQEARASREAELRLAVRQLSCRCVLLNSLLEKEKGDRELERSRAHQTLDHALLEIDRLRKILGEETYNVVQFPTTSR